MVSLEVWISLQIASNEAALIGKETLKIAFVFSKPIAEYKNKIRPVPLFHQINFIFSGDKGNRGTGICA